MYLVRKRKESLFEVVKIPCKYKRIRAKDVGRPGHHYIKIGIRKTKGRHGGRSEIIGGLRRYKGK